MDRIYKQKQVTMVFLETKIEIINLKHKELMGVESTIMADFIISLDDIEAICQTAEEDGVDVSKRLCGVYTKGGEYFKTFTPFEEVKEKWFTYKLNKR